MHKGDLLNPKAKVEIFNLHGERIMTASYENESSHVFSLHDVLPGIYLIKVISADQVESFKLIVRR